jgi:hypothetical protein
MALVGKPVRTEILIAARPEDVWDALRDWGALHERLVPGFVTAALMQRGRAAVKETLESTSTSVSP